MPLNLTFPILYSDTTTQIGTLSDCISCTVNEVVNTSFELTLDYPANGQYAAQLIVGRYIVAKPNPYRSAELFHIYRISRATSYIYSINAEHISYRSNHDICDPDDTYMEDAGTASDLMAYMTSQAGGNPGGGMVFATDIQASSNWSITTHTEIRNVMTLATKLFGGEWDISGMGAMLLQSRGTDRGVELNNATNLISLTLDDDISDVYTHIMPFWKGTDEEGDDVIVYSNPKFIPIGSASPLSYRTYVYDCSNQYTSKPTADELYYNATQFAYANWSALGSSVSQFNVQVVQRGKTIEGAYLTDADHVEIGDTIHINVPDIGISLDRRVTGITYNVLQDRITSVVMGQSRKSIVEIFSKVKTKEEKEAIKTKDDTDISESGTGDDTSSQVYKVTKVNDNKVEFELNDGTLEIWEADGEGNERYNFRHHVIGASDDDDDDEGEDEDDGDIQS